MQKRYFPVGLKLMTQSISDREAYLCIFDKDIKLKIGDMLMQYNVTNSGSN